MSATIRVTVELDADLHRAILGRVGALNAKLAAQLGIDKIPADRGEEASALAAYRQTLAMLDDRLPAPPGINAVTQAMATRRALYARARARRITISTYLATCARGDMLSVTLRADAGARARAVAAANPAQSGAAPAALDLTTSVGGAVALVRPTP